MENMAKSVGSTRGSDRTAMERFDSGGMALLPWTRQMLGVVWEQLRLLAHVIYYSFLAVFQMFRFEVHLRITDETGQHVQHMSTAANPSESFLFSSLFDGDNSVMVSGSNPLSNFYGDGGDSFPGSSHAGALLSSLRAEELCCGLVDDFVSRATECFPENDDGLCLGHHPSWKLGFPGDWNVFVTSTDSSSSEEARSKSTERVFDFKPKHGTVKKDEKDLHWGQQDDQNMGEFDSEESKALWESLSTCSDPYNPLYFSACISSCSNMGKTKKEKLDSSNLECNSPSKVNEEVKGPQGLGFWCSRSDSESSWGSSDGSCPDLDKEENERLWELFSSPSDPYNPLCFSASTASSAPLTDRAFTLSPEPEKASHPAYCTDSDTEERESAGPSSSEDDEDKQLWRSLSQNDDPYHPLNFRACLQTSPRTTDPPTLHVGGDLVASPNYPIQSSHNLVKQTDIAAKGLQKTRPTKPCLLKKHFKQHCHPPTTLVPWRRTEGTATVVMKEDKDNTPQKKVRFSPLVQVHVMRTWPFARQASRRGPWEELARDRDRLHRRVQDTELAIGYCFSQSHRKKMQAYLDSTSTSATPQEL